MARRADEQRAGAAAGPDAWRRLAACQGTPQEWWFPVDEHGRSHADVVPVEAERLCLRCPVRAACYQHALHHERFGVFAGIHEEQRARLRRGAHIRLREQPDPIAVERAIAAARAAELSALEDEDHDADDI